MSQLRVVIEVSPTRLEVVALRGREVAGRAATRFAPIPLAEQWPQCLDRLSERLSSMVKELGAAGASATVLHESPTAASGIFSCPSSAGRTRAMQAAMLALGEAAAFDLKTNPRSVEVIGADTSSDDPSAAPQIHCLGAADTEASAQALTRWVRSAGLEPEQLVPIDVPALVAAVEEASACGGGVRLALYVGEQSSIVAAASPGRLRFVREMAIGFESLVEALAAKMPAGADEYPAAAAAFLSKVGIPTREQAIGGGEQLQASDLLPLLRPTIQRWVLEIRQSLRFGLNEAERPAAQLVGIGPGAAVPRLVAVIAEQAGLKFEESPTAAHAGAIDLWRLGKGAEVNLVPATLRDRAIGRRVRRGVWVGTAVTGVLIAADATMTRTDLGQTRHEIESLKTRLAQAKPAADLNDQLAALRASVADAHNRIAARMAPEVHWDAALAMLSRVTPEGIRLGQVQLSVEGGKPLCRVQGAAPIGSTGSDAALKAYLDSLAAVPIVNSFKMGTTQRDEQSGAVVQTFEVALTLVDLPAVADADGRGER